MSEIKDGGPAFPASRMEQGSSPEAEAIGGYFEVQYPGMTLRDYFAAKAMQGFASEAQGLGKAGDDLIREQFDFVSRLSYVMADAMLKARDSD